MVAAGCRWRRGFRLVHGLYVPLLLGLLLLLPPKFSTHSNVEQLTGTRLLPCFSCWTQACKTACRSQQQQQQQQQQQPQHPRDAVHSSSSISSSGCGRRTSTLTVRTAVAVDKPGSSTSPESLDQHFSISRGLDVIEKPIRLPVWPVVNGLVFTVMDLLGLRDAAAWLEDKFGGRVAPMSLDSERADPFVLLVHHRHAFDAWDPVRPIFQSILGPEGFPSHPHRGFETVTMTVQGGLRHRDSMGVKQTYSDGDVQWLTAGRGVLHEEFWWWKGPWPQRGECELYQLWLNLPAERRMEQPSTEVLRDPRPLSVAPGVEVRRLGGGAARPDFVGGAAPPPPQQPLDGDDEIQPSSIGPGTTRDDVALLRATLAPGSSYELPLPAEATAIFYVRRGDVSVGANGEMVPRHHLAYTRREGNSLLLKNDASTEEADVLILAGLPLRQPIVSSGTWVVGSEFELEKARRDYNMGKLGRPWDHSLSDEEWLSWTKRYGPIQGQTRNIEELASLFKEATKEAQ